MSSTPRLFALITAAALASAPAFAQQQEPAEQELTDSAPTRVTEIEFDYTTVNGELVGPNMKLIGGRSAGKYPSLIRLRMGFNQEMGQSVNAVR